MNEYQNTFGDHIIAFFGSARSTRIYYRILRERAFARANPGSVRSAFNRLKNDGYIKRDGDAWTRTSKKYTASKRRPRLDFILSPFPKNAPDYAIVSFDVPEAKRYARDWIRNQLKIFGYRMVQQSVWVGPGPVPKEFKKVLIDLGIEKCIRTFRISQGAKIKT